jgi:chromosome segregation ATPase
MEILAFKQGCCITEIEITEVQSEIVGSNGTVGAFLQQVKLEHLNAKELDRSTISPQLKSAIKEEIDRFIDNSSKNAAAGLAVLERLNEELRGMIDEADQKICSLEETIATQKDMADKESRKQLEEIAKATQNINSYRDTIEQQQAEITTFRNDTNRANTEIIALNRQAGVMEANLVTARQAIEEAIDKHNKELVSRQVAERMADLAKQEAIHHQQVIDLLRNQAAKQGEYIGELKAKVTEMTTLNNQLHAKIEEINQERISELKGVKKRRGAGKGEKVDESM